VLDGAGLVAPWANRPIRVVDTDRCCGFLDGRQQLAHGVHLATAPDILFEVTRPGIKPLVSGQANALGLRPSLDDPAKLEGDVGVQSALASALDLLEIGPLKTVCHGLL